MNNKVPISSSVFERLELSVQKNLSAFGTVRAVLFKKIRQPFQLSVGKNKKVTRSFHWKVKCCEWSLCGDVFMSFRKYCRGMSQLRSTQLFTRAKTFHGVEYSWLLTVTASYHDQFMMTRYFLPRCLLKRRSVKLTKLLENRFTVTVYSL